MSQIMHTIIALILIGITEYFTRDYFMCEVEGAQWENYWRSFF